MASEKLFCVFHVDELLLGLDIESVQEIVRGQSVQAVPHTPLAIEGLMNLRGKILPVIGLRQRFGKPPSEASETMIVTSSPIGVVALRVDDVREVRAVAAESFETPPGSFHGAARELVGGVYKLQGELLLELDVSEVVRFSPPLPDEVAATSLA